MDGSRRQRTNSRHRQGQRASRRDLAPSRVSPRIGIRLESGREAPRKSWPGRRVLAPGVCSRSQPWQHACRAFPGNQPPPERSEPRSPRRHRHLGDGRGSPPRRLRGRGLGSARVERGGAWAGAEAGAVAGVSEPRRGLLHAASSLCSPGATVRGAPPRRLPDHPNSACPCRLTLFSTHSFCPV